MKFFAVVITLLILIVSVSFADSVEFDFKRLDEGKYVLTYEEHYYDGIGESVLSLRKIDNGYLVVWKGITDTTEIYADFDFNTQKMVLTDKDTSLTVVREGGILRVSGFNGEEQVEKILTVKSKKWIQLLPFSLVSFTLSDEKKIDFFLFDPYNIKVRNMKIEKREIETITVFGEQFTALKMSMRMGGILSPFWKSEIWNSVENGVHLKYEGLNVEPKMYKAKIYLKKVEFQP